MTPAQYSEFRQQEPLVQMALAGSPSVGEAIERQAQANVAAGRASDQATETNRIAGLVSARVQSVARQRNLVACTSNGSEMLWIGPIGALIAMHVLLAEGAETEACMQSVRFGGTI